MKSRNRRLSSSSSVDGSASPAPSDASVFLSSEDFSEGSVASHRNISCTQNLQECVNVDKGRGMYSDAYLSVI